MNTDERAREMSGRTLSTAKYRILLVSLSALLFLMLLSAECVGRYDLTIPEVVKILLYNVFHIDIPVTWTSMSQAVVMTLRLPRILGAILVGAALSLSGSAYQGVFKNPLVSPDILGVSSGACVGASVAILMHLNEAWIQILAFVFGVITVLMTILIPRLIKNNSITMLVLSGVIMSGIMGSALGIIKYVADAETELAAITYWQMGSLAKVTIEDIGPVAFPIIIGCILILAMRWQINILSLGENEAKSLGIKTSFVRTVIILCATMLTASAVCTCGTIGWVGLVIPHVGRLLVGPDNTKCIPITLVMGSMFVLIIDTLARSISGLEIPLSILTGIIGAPFYIFILARQRMKL